MATASLLSLIALSFVAVVYTSRRKLSPPAEPPKASYPSHAPRPMSARKFAAHRTYSGKEGA
jgi:hypothetical protein